MEFSSVSITALLGSSLLRAPHKSIDSPVATDTMRLDSAQRKREHSDSSSLSSPTVQLQSYLSVERLTVFLWLTISLIFPKMSTLPNRRWSDCDASGPLWNSRYQQHWCISRAVCRQTRFQPTSTFSKWVWWELMHKGDRYRPPRAGSVVSNRSHMDGC